MVYAIFILISFLASVIGCICGILGGVVGRKINKKINNAAVDKLFIGLLTVIMFVCVYNYMQFSR